MSNKTKTIIRTVSTIALIFGAYFETGVFTTICLVLIAISMESQRGVLQSIIDRITSLLEKITRE
jgi:hypothetical protein